MSRGLLN